MFIVLVIMNGDLSSHTTTNNTGMGSCKIALNRFGDFQNVVKTVTRKGNYDSKKGNCSSNFQRFLGNLCLLSK